VLRFILQAGQRKQRRPTLHLDEEIQVAVLSIGSGEHRTKDARLGKSVAAAELPRAVWILF